MNIFEFMSSSPWLTFFLAYLVLQSSVILINLIFRYLNIRKHGYPPARCYEEIILNKPESKVLDKSV